MGEYAAQDGPLTGREERFDNFSGAPKTVGGTLGGPGAQGTTSLTADEAGTGHTSGTTTDTAISDAGQHKKPSLMDKLNPKKDADGDGKAGFMD